MLLNGTLDRSVAAAAAIFAVFAGLAGALLLSEQNARKARFSAASLQIESRISDQIDALYAVEAYLANAGYISREKFVSYVDAFDLPRRAPGLQGVGFAMAARPGADDEQVRNLLQARYGVERTPWPETDQDVRFPIVILEPDDERNRAALGYDMYSDPDRRAAMDRAIRAGQIAATGVVRLKQEIDDDVQPGFLIYLAARISDGDDDEIDGFVYAPIRGERLFNSVLDAPSRRNLNVAAFLGDVGDDALIYSNFAGRPTGVAETIAIGGARATLIIAEPRTFLEALVAPPILTLLFGAILSVVSGAFYRSQIKRTETTRMLAEERKMRLGEREIALREMKHRMNNAIARILAIARMSSRTATSVDQFMEDFSGRMQAMSRAQHLATAVKWQQTTIGAVIESEVEQIAASGVVGDDFSGDEIEIDGNVAQALALVVHELATNAAKYGALAQGGAIGASWRREPSEKIVITWTERGLATPPDFTREGFGSKLCRLVIEDQLGGKVEREIGADAFTVVMRFDLPADAPAA